MKHAAFIKISLLSCFLLLAAACGGLDLVNKVETPVISAESPTTSENLITDSSDPVEVVRKAYEKMPTVRSYRCRHELTGPTGANLTTNMDVVAPDRIRSVQTGTGIETIKIGKDFYIKSPGSAWEKSGLLSSKSDDPVEDNKAANPFLQKLSEDFKVKALGSDTIDNMPMRVYQITSATPAQDEVEPVIKLWIGARDNLIYKFESEYDLKFGNDPGKMKSVGTLYDFGADIKIERPI